MKSQRFGTRKEEAGALRARGEPQAFDVLRGSLKVARVEWGLIGEHNQLNALAAIAAAEHVGVTPEQAGAALAEFKNVRRRMELRGEVRGIKVYDDFAHHPTAIRTTVNGLRRRIAPAERVLAIFEPRSNTMKLGTMKAQLPWALEEADLSFCNQQGLSWDAKDALVTMGAQVVVAKDVDAAGGGGHQGRPARRPSAVHEQWRLRRHPREAAQGPRMIRGPRVGLRHVIEADLPLLVQAAADPLARGDFSATQMANPLDIRKRFAETGYSTEDVEKLMICDAQDRPIGNVVHFRERRYTTAREIGWSVFSPADRGKGYASEAAALLVDYLFESLPIHRISCGMAPGNIASRRVAEKCGFTLEGRTRGVLFVAGEYLDGDLFAILRPEWAAAATRPFGLRLLKPWTGLHGRPFDGLRSNESCGSGRTGISIQPQHPFTRHPTPDTRHPSRITHYPFTTVACNASVTADRLSARWARVSTERPPLATAARRSPCSWVA